MQFRYASVLDVLSILLGSLLSLIAGTALPTVFAILGLIITEFTDFATADSLSDSLSNTVSNETISIEHFCINETNSDGFKEYLSSTDPGGLLQSNLYSLSYGVIAVGIAHLLGLLFSTILWSVVAANQGRKIKSKFMRAVLSQDISVSDVNPSTELTVHLIKLVAYILAVTCLG